MHTLKSKSITILIAALYSCSILIFNINQIAYAGELSERKVTIANPKPSANTNHQFDFTINSVSTVGSISFEYCSNSPLNNIACAAPAGLSLSGAIIGAQSGETGFIIDGSSTANKLVLTRVPVNTSIGVASYNLNNLVNPSTEATTYVRIATYASSDATGSNTDYGAVAFNTNSGFGAQAYVPPYLRFCTGITVSLSCNTSSGVLANLGELSPSRTATATSQFAAYTNDGSGYAVAMSGVTMTSGNNVIPPSSSPQSSQRGVSQFGMNLRANTNPNVGLNSIGAGTGTAQSGYNIANQFKFVPDSTIVISSLPTESNIFTASYIVNVSAAQPPGVYSSTITYICTAQF